jgi:hypothetical protein
MRLLASVFIALAAFGGETPAQRPDLAGVWTLVADSAGSARTVAATGDASFRRGDMGSGWGSPLTIAEEANRVVVSYPHFSTYDLQPPIRLTFNLDGSASSNRITLGHTTSELQSTAAWQDSALVIETRFPGPPGPDAQRLTTTVRNVLRLESSAVLVIETSRSGGAGGGASPIRTRYTKR